MASSDRPRKSWERVRAVGTLTTDDRLRRKVLLAKPIIDPVQRFRPQFSEVVSGAQNPAAQRLRAVPGVESFLTQGRGSLAGHNTPSGRA